MTIFTNPGNIPQGIEWDIPAPSDPSLETLSNLNITIGGNVTNTDSVESAIGKIEHKINDIIADEALIVPDALYPHNQIIASDVWVINHGLHKYPSVTIVDSAGTIIIGDIDYTSDVTIVLTFTGSFSGKAYLN